MKKKFVFCLLFAGIFITNISMVKSEDIYKYIFRPKPVSMADCEKLKNTYDIPVCTVDNDYWVGAIVACGGRRNLPKSDDFSRISKNILDAMIEDYDPSYFNEYYSKINNIAIYSDVPYQKKEASDSSGLISKWQNWRYNVNYNKVNGLYFSFDTKYTTRSSLYNLNREYHDYVREEKRKYQEYMKKYPDSTRKLSIDSRYNYMKRKIGAYHYKALYRDNYNLEAYAICRTDLLR